MSVIDEKTIEEYDKLYKGENYHMSDDLLVIAVMELIKEIRKQNEVLKDMQVKIVEEVALNFESIKEEEILKCFMSSKMKSGRSRV